MYVDWRVFAYVCVLLVYSVRLYICVYAYVCACERMSIYMYVSMHVCVRVDVAVRPRGCNLNTNKHI